MKIEFHPEASAEFQEAAVYYEKEVPGLGRAFISEVERVAELIGAHPVIGNPIDETFRRVVLVRFPFSVIYCAESEKLLIVAVSHQRRKPGYWHGRFGR
jgi:plasmid stabilization system protein ParE